MRLSRNWLTTNATTHTFLETARKDLSKYVWVVALIVDRFRDKRKKKTVRNETEMILLKWERSLKRLVTRVITRKKRRHK